MGEDVLLDKEVDRIASEVVQNDDAAIWLLNARAKLAMTKALTLNDGFTKADIKCAATNFCALPNIVNRIEAIRREGVFTSLLGDVTRLSILGSVKYKSCELEGDKDTNERFARILECLREEINKNKPTMSKNGELICRTMILAIDLLTFPRKPFRTLFKVPINFTVDDKRSQEEDGLRR